MTYSFTRIKKRRIFNLFAKIWLALFLFAIAFIVGIDTLYTIKIKFIQSSTNQKKEEIVSIEKQTDQTDKL
ncbi:MAG: hypothetical protein J1D99_04745, partial [Campylobacter sp.]|nr:hypothetical protein [Campylobacter sp.]